MGVKQSVVRAGIRAVTATHVAVYRASGGRLGADVNGEVVLLTTKGRTTGKLRTTPVMRLEHDGAIHVIGSAGGAAADPAWFRNLRDEPRVRVRDRDRVVDARAVVLSGAERDAAYGAAVDQMPFFADYEERTDRTIPVARLDPLDRSARTDTA